MPISGPNITFKISGDPHLNMSIKFCLILKYTKASIYITVEVECRKLFEIESVVEYLVKRGPCPEVG